MSQKELADAVNISPSFYGNIERGNRIPSVDTLVAIANVLEIGTDFLLVDSLDAIRPQLSPQERRRMARYLRDRIGELIYDGEEEEEEFPDGIDYSGLEGEDLD